MDCEGTHLALLCGFSLLFFHSVHSASRSLYYLPFIPLLCSLTRLCVKGVWGGCGVKDQQSADPAFLWGRRGGERVRVGVYDSVGAFLASPVLSVGMHRALCVCVDRTVGEWAAADDL